MKSQEKTYPMILTKDLTVFPGSSVPIAIHSSLNCLTLKFAKENDSPIIVVPAREGKHPAEASLDEHDDFATLCHLEQLKGDSEQGYQVILTGLSRGTVAGAMLEQDHAQATFEEIKTVTDAEGESLDSLMNHTKELAIAILKMTRGSGIKRLTDLVQGIEEPDLLVDLCAAHLDLSRDDRRSLILESSLRARLLATLGLLKEKQTHLEVQVEISKKLSVQMDKKQREVILREQLHAIREELDDMDNDDQRGNFLSRIDQAPMPESVKKIAREEARRLESTPSVSPEYANLRNYLELILALPWPSDSQPHSKIEIDLDQARQLLERRHYGLEKVKKRIIQHLAIMQLRQSAEGSVLLLLGPPGVGKTSLARSIADAMGRKFVKASLGGVRDESDIRGHRRTYVGSMPGRIIQGIKRVGQRNPVFLLDEIDKLGKGWGGDPSGALLEVLDPEQNHAFEDHYLDMPYDLSDVVFIATANSLEGIPAPLRDRLEIIHVSAYTSAEKLRIAKDHLWTSELEKHGIRSSQLSISESAIIRIISHYTREAGVRGLKRQLAAICRYYGETILSQKDQAKLHIKSEQLKEILGPEPYHLEIAETILPAGVATGLAWTPLGGDILFIESKQMPGKGKLTITGQLGDVMRESLHIAMSHLRAHLASINPRFNYENVDIHVHVPAGAIPKDGPSAGITMLCSLVSLIAQRPIAPSIAMSGEITLRGAILPVGGIKEKVIAAHAAGIQTILLSEKNEKDLEEVPQEIRDQISFVWLKNIHELLHEVFHLDMQIESQNTGYMTPNAATASHHMDAARENNT